MTSAINAKRVWRKPLNSGFDVKIITRFGFMVIV
jgi:hypothetical protein